MSALLGWTVRVVAALALAAVVGGGMWYWVATQRPPLTADLPGPWREATAEFDRRLNASFPIGSSETEMEAVLRRQGFRLRDETGSADKERFAGRSERSFVCNIRAEVHWRADAGGRLVSIRGWFGERGCI